MSTNEKPGNYFTIDGACAPKGDHRPLVHVYYGAAGEGGWSQGTLAKATEIIGRDCEWFDGLQADFHVEVEQRDAVVKKLNEVGIPAEYRVGQRCPPCCVTKRRISRIKAPSPKLVDVTVHDGHMLGRKTLESDGAKYRSERNVGVVEFEIKYAPADEIPELNLFRMRWAEAPNAPVGNDMFPWHWRPECTVYVPTPIMCLAIIALCEDAKVEGAARLPDAFPEFLAWWGVPKGAHVLDKKTLKDVEVDVRCKQPMSLLSWRMKGRFDAHFGAAEARLPTSIIADAFAGVLADKIEE